MREKIKIFFFFFLYIGMNYWESSYIIDIYLSYFYLLLSVNAFWYLHKVFFCVSCTTYFVYFPTSIGFIELVKFVRLPNYVLEIMAGCYHRCIQIVYHFFSSSTSVVYNNRHEINVCNTRPSCSIKIIKIQNKKEVDIIYITLFQHSPFSALCIFSLSKWIELIEEMYCRYI